MVTPTKACTGRLTLASLVSLMYKPDEWAVLTSKRLLLNVPICSANRETKIRFIIFSRSRLLAFSPSRVLNTREGEIKSREGEIHGSRVLAFWISPSRILVFVNLAFSPSHFFGSRVLAFSLFWISRSRVLTFGYLAFS